MPQAMRVPDTFGFMGSRALEHRTCQTLPVTCTAPARGMTCGRYPPRAVKSKTRRAAFASIIPHAAPLDDPTSTSTRATYSLWHEKYREGPRKCHRMRYPCIVDAGKSHAAVPQFIGVGAKTSSTLAVDDKSLLVFLKKL